MSQALDEIEDARKWVDRALEEALAVWTRMGRRYARRLSEQAWARDAAVDVMTLAARRLVPLPRPLLRWLPDERDDPLSRAFNALDRADRQLLSHLHLLGEVRGPRAEHLASALERLASARRALP